MKTKNTIFNKNIVKKKKLENASKIINSPDKGFNYLIW